MRIISPLILLAIGLVGGLLAVWIGTPIPFLLGSLMAVGATVVFIGPHLAFDLHFPPRVREAFVVVIGVMIGGTFTPDGFRAFGGAWASIPAVLIFVAATLWVNFHLFRRFGYDRATAFYSAMPGGLVDSVTIGEKAGGDVRIMTVQHFVRIVLIVSLVPLGYWAWTGEAVGSAAGVDLGGDAHPMAPLDWVIVGIASALGYWGGKRIGLPAYFLMGPLILVAALHGFGLLEAQLPGWMLSMAQLVVGTGFGARFGGMNRAMLARGLALGVVSVALMLVIGIVLAFVVSALLGEPLDVMILCFAPGGITEMGLIALSLNANPVFVTAHHLLRIVVTVAFAGASTKWMKGET